MKQVAMFYSNGSIYNFYPNLLNISFRHKMNKNKAYTWNEHLSSTENGNLQVKSAILLSLPKLTTNLLQLQNEQY